MLLPSQHPAYREWAIDKTSFLPSSWQRTIVNEWEKVSSDFDPSILGAKGEATRQAAHGLYDVITQFKTINIPLNATDDDVCARADEMSDYCNSLAEVFHDKASLRAAMERVLCANSIPAWIGEADKIERKGKACATRECRDQTDTIAIKRMIDPHFWRRNLRRVHARVVEGAAIKLGRVKKSGECYVSNESLFRHMGQKRRAVAMLENTQAINEMGDKFTLLDLVEKSVSNPVNRRNEVMLRLNGFESIAKAVGHVGLFITITCSSRMHAYKTIPGKKFAVKNRKYDGTTPKEAQRYLSKIWAQMRSKFDREGFKWYGFRIAEPNHDGTPHWHILVFFDPVWPGSNGVAAMPRVQAIVRRYALKDSGRESGARKRRVKFEKIDWSKGSAAAYLAKYVSKNIDGYKVEKDMHGNDMFQASRRVQAWASTWNIRQFQQICGVPVTVWREFRRIESIPDSAPSFVHDAHAACNKVEAENGETQGADWGAYVTAQGGVFVGRDYRIRLAVEDVQGVGRYGEPLGCRPVGVTTTVVETYRDGIIPNLQRDIVSLVRSVRHVWQIIRGKGSAIDASARRAWTRVNNCTRSDFSELRKKFDEFGSLVKKEGYRSFEEFCGPVNWPEIEKSLQNVA